jgi:pimeloyl-ACP methyl ester carboxylesterase
VTFVLNLLVLLALLAVLVLVLNLVVAIVAAYPHLLARGGATVSLRPEACEDVDLRGDLKGWWCAASGWRIAVVLIHGWAGNREERWVPFAMLARALGQNGISVLLFDLGYVGGRRMYSGGPREAEDVLQAARWVQERCGLPVVLWGFSAGGHAALLAAHRDPELPMAVIADSAFPDPGAMVASRAARVLHLPVVLLNLAPRLLPLLVGAAAEPLTGGAVPTLLIHGSEDREVPVVAARRLQQRTGARLHIVEGAGHEGAFRHDPDAYLEVGLDFLQRA